MKFLDILMRGHSRDISDKIKISGFLTINDITDKNNPICLLNHKKNIVVDGAKWHAARLFAADSLGYAAHSIFKMKIGSGASGYTPSSADTGLQLPINGIVTINDPTPLIVTTGNFSVFITGVFNCPSTAYSDNTVSLPVSTVINQEGIFVDDTVPLNSYPMLVTKVFPGIPTLAGMVLQFIHEIRFGTVS